MYDNGCGFGAYLLTCIRNRTTSRYAIFNFALRHWLGWWMLRRLLRPNGHARRLVAIELKGMLRSPWAYISAQRRARQLADAMKEGNLRVKAINQALSEPINETPSNGASPKVKTIA
jgi:hypothetical protein